MDPERTRVIYRDLNRTYPTLVRGEGIYLFDDEGNRYIDGSGGSAAVTAIGHAVPEVVSAIANQAARLAYAPTHAFTTEAVETCARIRRIPGSGVGVASGNTRRSSWRKHGPPRPGGDRLRSPFRAVSRRPIGWDADVGAGDDLSDHGAGRIPR